MFYLILNMLDLFTRFVRRLFYKDYFVYVLISLFVMGFIYFTTIGYSNMTSNINTGNGKHYVCQTFNGKLGNHIFQYASAYGIAKINNLAVILGQNDDLVEYFKVPSAEIRVSRDVCKRFVSLYAQHCCSHDTSLMTLQKHTNYILGEYLQSWKYFEGYFNEVRAELTFKDEIGKSSEYIVENYREASKLKFSSPTMTVIGIHIRRGDVASVEFADSGQGVGPAPDGYIHRAIDYVINKYEHVIFVVCSDGLDYAKYVTNYRNITVQYFYISAIHDMSLLASCDHVIMTVGSYGWWAGFLSRGTVIYYKYPMQEGSPARNEYNYDDFFPRDWIGLA